MDNLGFLEIILILLVFNSLYSEFNSKIKNTTLDYLLFFNINTT